MARLNEEQFNHLVALLQEDINGNSLGFNSEQIEGITGVLGLQNMKTTLPQETIQEIIEYLTDANQISKMHLFDRKALSKFVLSLSKAQTTDMAKFLTPFFTTYTNKFMQSLSTPQQVVVFDKVLPSIMQWLSDDQKVKMLTMTIGTDENKRLMYQRSDIATALEFVETTTPPQPDSPRSAAPHS